MSAPKPTRKPNGDVSPQDDSIDRVEREARRTGKSRTEICPADHSHIRGRHCGYCGSYFRGDDMG